MSLNPERDGTDHHYQPINPDDDQYILHNTPSADVIDMTWRRRFYILLSFSFFCLSLLLGLFIFAMGASTCSSRPFIPDSEVILPYSPAPVNYVNKWLKGDPDTPKFVGNPSTEMDQAWHDLLSGTAIRFSEQELIMANNATSIRLQDGGYVAGLGISHSLHCVKRIKQYLHPDYYYPGDQNWEELFLHVDHCLESLRQSVMCSADVSVYTLEWTPHSKFKPAVRVPQPHACVDWEALHGWMEGRAASLSDAVGPAESIYNGKLEEDSG